MLGVRAPDESQELVDRLATLGYDDCGGATGRRYLRKRDGERFNVQVVEYGGPLWRANLVFREYLRSHSDASRR